MSFLGLPLQLVWLGDGMFRPSILIGSSMFISLSSWFSGEPAVKLPGSRAVFLLGGKGFPLDPREVSGKKIIDDIDLIGIKLDHLIYWKEDNRDNGENASTLVNLVTYNMYQHVVVNRPEVLLQIPRPILWSDFRDLNQRLFSKNF